MVLPRLAAVDRKVDAQADDDEPAGAPDDLQPSGRAGKQVAGRAGDQAPRATGHQRDGHEHHAEHEELDRCVPGIGLTNWGRMAAKKMIDLGLVRPTTKPSRTIQAGDFGVTVAVRAAAVADGLNPEEDEVAGTEGPDHGEKTSSERWTTTPTPTL